MTTKLSTTVLAVSIPIAAATAFRLVLTTARVVGTSMSPTLADGARLLVVRRWCRQPRVGEVIVFANPRSSQEPSHLVKRVVAASLQVSPIDKAIVPAGHLIVRGDNPHSLDSRQLGPIKVRSVLGVAIFTPGSAHASVGVSGSTSGRTADRGLGPGSRER